MSYEDGGYMEVGMNALMSCAFDFEDSGLPVIGVRRICVTG